MPSFHMNLIRLPQKAGILVIARLLAQHGKIYHIAPMTREAFESTLSDKQPPAGLTPLLEALWYDAKGDWQQAHNIAQDIHNNNGCWIHAYLHRKEGDLGNASYWYRRAGQPVPSMSLEREWKQIVEALIKT